MTRFEARLTHAGNLVVGGTGLVYAWMRYLAVPADPDALVNHPLQPLVQHLHVLVAPLLVFALGSIWVRHAWGGFTNGVRERRWSGSLLLAMAAPMVASGYLLQVAVEPSWRRLWVGVHVVASLLWVLATGGHVAAGLVARRAAATGAAAGADLAEPGR